MKSRTPEFIRSRIEWRAKKHGLPYKNSGFWSDAPPALKGAVPDSVNSPVVFTMSEGGEATVIGAEEVFVILKRRHFRIRLDQIDAVSSPCLRERKQKSEFDALELSVANGSVHRLPTEKGAACFAFWNILLMLVRMDLHKK